MTETLNPARKGVDEHPIGAVGSHRAFSLSARIERERETTVSHVLEKARFWLRFQSVDINDRQRKALNRMLDAGPGGFEGGMTTRKYAHLDRVSRATAYRELSDLVAKGCLNPTGGGGRSRSYEIRLEP